MNDFTNTNVVHESETQRQHVRVRLPGVVEFTAGREHLRLQLDDVSAGGMSFQGGNRGFRVGESHRGNLVINLDGIAVALNVAFQVRNHDPRTSRTGVAFKDLGQREISALRHIITSFLSGEVVRADQVLQTVKRDNFTKPRAAPAKARQVQRSRLGTLTLTLVLATAGAMAFIYAGQQINRVLFMTTASAAKVAGPIYTVEMPREGTVRSLVPADGVVKKGAAIASIEAPALDLVRQQALGSNLSAEQLQKILGVKIKGTITSPCDCRVQGTFVTEDQYVARGTPLFELMPLAYKPYIIARFRYDQMDALQQGAGVRFRVSGDSETRAGTITQIRASGQGNAVDSDVLVTVEPSEPLPSELLLRPVEVATGGVGFMPDVSPLLATPTANATP